MIEPFDEQRHAALIQNQPIQADAKDGLTHKLDVDTRENVIPRQLTAPLCHSTDGTRLSPDWRLVNCPDCRKEATR